ncbi:23S rRNA (adenine(2503)-C(2))-methyltransferase RlmN [Alcanivorax sp. S6407]|uniref:23S rRNA (adenine(2503)-C(2))-methyltransferase RlmN n=1 Tax=Alcanivorax sp. S6407 TaxID=2926424 RepID=UPI001FF4C3D0|nr:23S rRNA (adenine(2503)-C(2))-methyltransferase RlmN [Alcanivorax sp. S6407]MCK0153170.1 23S rRNA (adenine(2503)-C(2))-methyltransferase RlmN [Alcanivorax sp. S6407]
MTAQQKVNLLGLDRPQMEAFFLEMGEKKFRAQQVLKWIHHHQADSFEQMTDVGKALRQKLSEVAEIRGPEVIHESISRDGTRKWVFEMDNGGAVETVFIPDGRRGTLCVSSQVGCAVDCSFCSTGKQGFQRDMTSAEIIGQVWQASRSFGPRRNLGEHPITNVVMMGMGEPLLNYDNVLSAMRIMKDDLGYGIGKKRITLSTSGVIPKIDQLSQDLDVALAVSLHAPNDELRNELVPLNRKYPLKELMAACKRYTKNISHKHNTITMEYVMLRDVNDKPEHARQLVKLLNGLPVKVNLIPFNPFPHAGYERSRKSDILEFHKYLNDNGLLTTVRTTRGDDIDAACGQLVGQVQDRTRRSERWKQSIFHRSEHTDNNTAQA